MRETLIAFFLFALLAGSGLAMRFLDMFQLVYAGGIVAAAGLVFSLPFAVWYHWLLYRTLKPRGELSPRWIWNPTREHSKLRPEERGKVLLFFSLGAAGWVACVLGLAIVGMGVWVGRSG